MNKEGAVAVIERNGRFLAITRSQDVVAPGKVCFPGGGIEQGETAEEALIRECSEEIGVMVRPVRLLGVSVTPWNVKLHWYAAAIDPDAVPVPNPVEVAAVQWLTLAEMLAHPDTLESNKAMLEKWLVGRLVF